MARVKKAQNGLLMAQEIMAKRKAASKDTTAKYNREDAMKSMSTANKGFDASKDQSRRDSIAKAFEPTRDANMKQMGYSKTKPKGFKLGGKVKKVTKAVGLTKAKMGKSMGKCKNGC